MPNPKIRLLVEIPVAMEAQGNKRKVLKMNLASELAALITALIKMTLKGYTFP
jgi:hypothetical protein